MTASPEALERAAGGPVVARRIDAARSAVLAGQREHFTRACFDLRDVCLQRYIVGLFQGLAVERLRVFFLNSRSDYITDEWLSEGGCDSVTGSRRQLVTRSLDLGATAIVLAHNHPSGIASASPADISVTRHLAELLGQIELLLSDHLIVAGTTVVSMRGAGHL